MRYLTETSAYAPPRGVRWETLAEFSLRAMPGLERTAPERMVAALVSLGLPSEPLEQIRAALELAATHLVLRARPADRPILFRAMLAVPDGVGREFGLDQDELPTPRGFLILQKLHDNFILGALGCQAIEVRLY